MSKSTENVESRLKKQIYSASESGSISSLKRIVAEGRKLFDDDKDRFDALFDSNERSDGRTCTPLVISAKNNHFDVVEYLVSNCQVDVETTGTVRFDGDREDILGAPPLWTAATAGHAKIVRFLVDSAGADVHHATATESTPLRGACFDGHLDIVRFLGERGAKVNAPNYSGQTPLMVAAGRGHLKLVKYLLTLSADLNLKTTEGYSALHIVASSDKGTVEILKLLEKAGSRVETTPDGWTVGFLAATAGHSAIVDYVINKHDVTSKERAEILELYGSVLFDKNGDRTSAMSAWKRAMAIRIEHDIVLRKTDVIRPLAVYNGHQEAITPDELGSVECDVTDDSLEMHSLLVRERIIGARRSTAYYIRRRGLKYSATGLYARTMDLWTHALAMHRTIIKAEDPDVKAILINCVHTFRQMIDNAFYPRLDDFFAWGLDETLRSKSGGVHQTKLLVILLNFVAIWMKIDYVEFDDEWRSRMALIVRLVRSGVVTAVARSSPLHVACNQATSQGLGYVLTRMPNRRLIRVLLQCSADCLAVDRDRNTPLHILIHSMVISESFFKMKDSVFYESARMLIEAGASVNCRNSSKQRPVDLIFSQGVDVLAKSYPATVDTVVKLSLSGISLQSLAACAVVDYDLETTDLPAKLRAFVNLH